MPATGGIVTLSQVRSWNTDYLTEAADHWTRTAVVWEDSFTALANQISMPGGTPWEGGAADAAFTRAHADRMTVIGLADELHAAARVARTGANQIDSARAAVLRVVEAAHVGDFVVGEDFSVTCPGLFDPVSAAARQAQAQAIATNLRATVGTLVATDAEVASSLTAATGGLGTGVFPESGDAPATVQLVDFKSAPPTPQPGTPDDPVNDRAPSPSPISIPPTSRNWPPAPIEPEELAPFGTEGTVIQKTAEEATKQGVSPKLPLSEGKQLGGFMGKLGNFGDLYKAFEEGRKELPREGWKNTLIDIVPKTAGSLAGQTLGGTFGALSGARVGAATGNAWGHIPGTPGGATVNQALGAIFGAATGAYAGTTKGGELGEALGKGVSGYLRAVFD
ncbi:hypothetical protein [Mycolicibacterium sp.]|uniref:hypothetical protein n=1 Tax=Mycolicibacterium sp. TaxID=2320850 RepID=UPI0028B1B9DB|nr:hypothetical protein [Mycolicibacterium sp.]